MLDQDTALALLIVARKHAATIALVGNRAQLPAVGRGGVLDIAAQLSPRVFDKTSVHRFTDPEYAELTMRMRAGEDPALLFDRPYALGLVVLHQSTAGAQELVARNARAGEAITVATNEEARELNMHIRGERVRAGPVGEVRTTTGRWPSDRPGRPDPDQEERQRSRGGEPAGLDRSGRQNRWDGVAEGEP